MLNSHRLEVGTPYPPTNSITPHVNRVLQHSGLAHEGVHPSHLEHIPFLAHGFASLFFAILARGSFGERVQIWNFLVRKFTARMF